MLEASYHYNLSQGYLTKLVKLTKLFKEHFLVFVFHLNCVSNNRVSIFVFLSLNRVRAGRRREGGEELRMPDQLRFLCNGPSTPPLSLTLTLTSYLGQNCDLGEG